MHYLLAIHATLVPLKIFIYKKKKKKKTFGTKWGKCGKEEMNEDMEFIDYVIV